MYSPKDSEPSFKLPPKSAPAPAKPKPDTFKATGVPGIEANSAGQLRTVEKPLVKLPEIHWENCFMGCIGGPNGPIEVHEDRCFFKGGSDEGYEDEGDAEEARALLTPQQLLT